MGQLIGHTTLIALMIKLGPTQRQDSRLCGDEKVDIVHIVCHRLALACKGCRTLGLMFLTPKNLENMRKPKLQFTIKRTNAYLMQQANSRCIPSDLHLEGIWFASSPKDRVPTVFVILPNTIEQVHGNKYRLNRIMKPRVSFALCLNTNQQKLI